MPREQLYADTNVIIEAFRLTIWKALTTANNVFTVDKCVEEALRGDTAKHGYVPVDRGELEGGLAKRIVVTPAEKAKLAADHAETTVLDEGERELFAHLHANGFTVRSGKILTADKAAIVAASKLGWLDAIASLENMCQPSGINATKVDQLDEQFRERWLSTVRTNIALGNLG